MKIYSQNKFINSNLFSETGHVSSLVPCIDAHVYHSHDVVVPIVTESHNVH